jgi:hypothetical protein
MFSVQNLMERSACFGQRQSGFGKGTTGYLSFHYENRGYGLFELGNLLWVSGISIVWTDMIVPFRVSETRKPFIRNP